MKTRYVLLSIVVIAGSVMTAYTQNLNEAMLKALQFRSIGPAVQGGRIDDLAVVENKPSIMYVGSAAGGVWKTVNNGTTWQPVFDNENVSSIGDIAISPTNPEIVWVGTGEPNNRQSSSFGDGIYKSTDAGRTWKNVGLHDSQSIGRVIVDPRDANTVYVAALGHLWGANKERGVFKTVDGGASWTNVLFINEDTGVSDIAMDPANNQILFAAAYQHRRTAWGYNGGGPGSGLYKTSDAGKTWTKLSAGLPTGTIGRIGVDVYRKNPEVVYATIENQRNGGVYRSDDRGETWRKMSNQNPRPSYYSQIRVDPNDDNRIYVLGSNFMVSSDGGKTFADPKTGRPGPNVTMTPMYDVGVHGDHHALWIDPADSDHLVLGNDGGLYFTYDRTLSWDKVNNLPIGQFYAVSTDMRKPYYIYGGLQDTHSFGGPSSTHHQIGIINQDWTEVDFGDGMYSQVDPTDPTTLYIEASNGNLVRVNLVTGDRKDIRPFAKAGEPPYRYNWTPPLQISPYDPKTIYFAADRFFKSTDRGDTWTVSSDLTKAQDRDKFPIMGVLPSTETLSRHDGVSAWGTITTLAESAAMRGLIWVGTDDGNVQLSRDGGKTFTNVADRINGLPKEVSVSRVEPSHTEAGTAYVTFDRHGWDDFNPYVYMTTDFGQTWKSLSAGLPETGWVHFVKEHPKNPNFLVAGSETGLFVSINRGARWTRLKNNLPTVPVDDLIFHPRDNDMILGTHGRSIFVLDDVEPLAGLTTEVLNSDVHLFDPRPALVFKQWKNESYGAQRQFIGPNPAYGAMLNYYLKSAPQGDVKVSVTDADGKLVKQLVGTKDVGINRVAWDLRYAAPEGVSGAKGPLVAAGKYTIKVAAGGKEVSKTVQVDTDQGMPISETERKAQVTFLTSVNRLQSAIQKATVTVANINTQIAALSENLKKLPSVPAKITSAVSSIQDQARQIQQKLAAQRGGGEEGGDEGFGQGNLRSRASSLFDELDGSLPTGPQQGTLTGPTAIQNQKLEQLSSDVNAVTTQLNNLVTVAIRNLNDQINKNNIPVVIPPPL
jgi:photosystem II stability/assembly factor-like uncharacterized protein